MKVVRKSLVTCALPYVAPTHWYGQRVRVRHQHAVKQVPDFQHTVNAFDMRVWNLNTRFQHARG